MALNFCRFQRGPYATDAGAIPDSNGEHARGGNDQPLYHGVGAASSAAFLEFVREQAALASLEGLSLDGSAQGSR